MIGIWRYDFLSIQCPGALSHHRVHCFDGSIIFMDRYSSATFRSFKTFVGELTAVAAGMFVGIHEAIPVIESHVGGDPWAAAAKKLGVVVSGLKSQQVVDGSVRLNLVSLYSGFDLFMAGLRTTFKGVQGRDWVQHDGDGPFAAIGRNTKPKVDAHVERIGAHRIILMEHYRLVRNAIVHPSHEALNASKQFFLKNTEKLCSIRREYGTQTAPAKIDELTFHDIKLFARVALDVTKGIDQMFDPGDCRLQELLRFRQIGNGKSKERKYNASVGWLRTEYGLNAMRAERIVKAYLTQELEG